MSVQEKHQRELDPAMFLAQAENLARTHREHELYYSQAPLIDAAHLQQVSRTLKALAGRWRDVTPLSVDHVNRYAGCDDLNSQAAIETLGVLFLEGEGEPGEITRIKRELATMAADQEQTGSWLGEAMEASWMTARASLEIKPLADLIGERHRIIAANWQNAYLSTIVAHLLRRAVEILDQIDFTPAAIRADLRENRFSPRYLYSAAELIDRAADLLAESAVLVHESERRWRMYWERLEALTGKQTS